MNESATIATARRRARQLFSRTRWTRELLETHQRNQLTALLRHAVSRSPYYRDTLGAIPDGDTALDQLPTLSKATLMSRFNDIVTDPRLRREDCEAHLRDSTNCERGRGHFVFATAGSTGERAIIPYTTAEFAYWVAAQLRMMLAFGVTPGMRVAAIGAPGPLHLSRQMFAELTAGQPMTAPELSVTTPLPELVAALNHYQPDAIPTYPSIAGMLAQEQLAGRLHIRPRLVATGAEVLTDSTRSCISAAWGIEPDQAYLATEAPLIASTSSGQIGMHIWEDLVLIEIVDKHNHPVRPGVPGDKILLTNLINRTLPLIRYELSDCVTLMAGPDRRGWPFRRIARIEGRTDDILDLPGPDGRAIRMHPLAVLSAIDASSEVIQHQIVHDHGKLRLQVVLREGAARDTSERLRETLLQTLAQAGAVPRDLTVTAVPAIDREPGDAAKLKPFKRPSTPRA